MMSSYLNRAVGTRNANPARSSRERRRHFVAHNLEAEPIFTLLEQRYDIPLVEAEYELEIISADHEVATAL